MVTDHMDVFRSEMALPACPEHVNDSTHDIALSFHNKPKETSQYLGKNLVFIVILLYLL